MSDGKVTVVPDAEKSGGSSPRSGRSLPRSSARRRWPPSRPLVDYAREPRCAEMQADGVPCETVTALCEQCLHVTWLRRQPAAADARGPAAASAPPPECNCSMDGPAPFRASLRGRVNADASGSRACPSSSRASSARRLRGRRVAEGRGGHLPLLPRREGPGQEAPERRDASPLRRPGRLREVGPRRQAGLHGLPSRLPGDAAPRPPGEEPRGVPGLLPRPLQELPLRELHEGARQRPLRGPLAAATRRRRSAATATARTTSRSRTSRGRRSPRPARAATRRRPRRSRRASTDRRSPKTNSPDVPVCTDCHKSHAIPTRRARRRGSARRRPARPATGREEDGEVRPLREGLPDLRRRTSTAGARRSTPGRRRPAEKIIAVCTDCHGVHEIARTKDADSGGAPEEPPEDLREVPRRRARRTSRRPGSRTTSRARRGRRSSGRRPSSTRS